MVIRRLFRSSFENLSCAVVLPLSAVAMIGLMPASTSANSIELNLYGASYHLLEEWQSRNDLNEFNLGYGVRTVVGSDSTSWAFLEGATFKDSFENQATYLSLGFLLRVFGQFRFGLNLAAYKSRSVGGVRAAPIPIVAITLDRLTINAAYLPKRRGVNPYHIFGAYASLRLINLQPKTRR